MCWIDYSGLNSKPLVAEEDINVIKFLGIRGYNLFSPFQNTKYNIGKAMPKIHIKLEKPEWSNEYEIEAGYHSYQYGFLYAGPSDYTSANNIIKIKYCDGKTAGMNVSIDDLLCRVPYECVIPKGTTYYVNEFHEIVSETIVVKKAIDYDFDTPYGIEPTSVNFKEILAKYGYSKSAMEKLLGYKVN